MAEGRLDRWSRLKQKGGADAREETLVAEAKAEKAQADVAEPEPLGASLPGGVQVRNFVPAMAPLAPEPEEDDDRLTRGIGHADPDEDSDGDDVDSVQAETEDFLRDEEGNPIYDTDALFAGIEEEELTEEQAEIVAELPPVESISEETDVTPFLREGVPEFLKRRALRMLWRANPFFNFRDGLNDYDEDFNIVHKIIEEGTGAYQVGRGHLTEDELKDMMPEEAKRAFDEDEDEELGDEITDDPALVEREGDEDGESEEIGDAEDDLDT